GPADGFLGSRGVSEEQAEGRRARAGDGVMDRRNLERVDGGIDRLRRRRLTGKVRLETAEIAEERVCEDVFVGPSAQQERLDGSPALRARGRERRHEDEGKE